MYISELKLRGFGIGIEKWIYGKWKTTEERNSCTYELQMVETDGYISSISKKIIAFLITVLYKST